VPVTADGDPRPGPSLRLDPTAVHAPDRDAEPAGYVVESDDGTRLHFLDWDGPTDGGRPLAPVLLVPGFAQSAWSWAPVARRIRARVHVVAMDLRGHGLSDAPVDGYEPASLARDAVAVAEGAGILDTDAPLVLAGHGFGGSVAAGAAALLGSRCGGLVLVDGGWESMAATSDLTPDELVRALEEPPEVLRSMAAYLADREAFDPGSWDADQERAARETVVELPSRRLVPAIHPHVRDGVVASMFEYDPLEVLAAVEAPVLALIAADDEAGTHRRSFEEADRVLRRLGRPAIPSARFDDGHNLMRYRPVEVAAAVLGAAEAAASDLR
jgi:pimeloyl-ACP methyl ester carboxylesterase